MFTYTIKPDIGQMKNFRAPTGGVFVHNVLGTKAETPPEGYDDFLRYWESKSGLAKPARCMAIDPHKIEDGDNADCSNLVGAHVRIDGEDCADDCAWIVPLCSHCNNENRTWSIYLPEGTVLVPLKMSNKRKTASHEMDGYLKSLFRFFFRDGKWK